MRIIKAQVLELLWFLTRVYLRLRGAKVGKNVRCSGFPYVKIKKGGRLVIEDGASITSSNWANPLNVGRRAGFYAAPGAEIILRSGCGVSSSRFIAHEKIEVEEKVFVGADCLICDSDMHEVPLWSDNVMQVRPIVIRKKAFIGGQCIILKGVTIGEGAVIGAGSTITSSVEDHGLVISSNQKQVKSFVDQ